MNGQASGIAGGSGNPVLLDAIALSAAIHSRQLSCEEVMGAFLQHIAACNPHVNAIVSLRYPEVLLAEARARDDDLAHGRSRGWMHGFPHAIKDLAATAGLRTTLGSPLFKDFVPVADTVGVERIRRQGAIIIGKTNVPEFGMGSQSYNPVFGVTRNAYAPERTAGGSSGGAAAALALRMVPVADGSDMMGSLRNPAAFNNVLGFRPSYGLVPSAPAPELFLRQLSTEGPMARTVADLAMLLSVQAGYDPRAPLSLDGDCGALRGPLQRDFRDVRVAYMDDWGGRFAIEPEVRALCRAALPVFEAIGCTVEEAAPDFPPQQLWESWLTLRHWLTAGYLGDLFEDPVKRAQIKPEVRWEIENGLKLSGLQVYRASVARSAWYEAVRRFFTRYDFLLLTSAQVLPFDAQTHWPGQINGLTMDTYHRWMEVTVPASMAGCPVINVPVGFSAGGLPAGMQIIGPPRSDLAVLQLAYAYEQATAWVARYLPGLLRE